MAIYAVGDLQGCADQFNDLLGLVGFGGNDVVWLVGDLVNRGPKSLQALRMIKTLDQQAITVLGNHDLHLIAAAYGYRELNKSDTLDDILQAPDKIELIEWLRHQPLLHTDTSIQWSMVHAGLAPPWTLKQAQELTHEVAQHLQSDDINRLLANMYGNKPTHWRDDFATYERLRFTINACTRMRFCDEKGGLALKEKGSPENHTREELIPWFAHPDRRSINERIIFGHWSTLGLRQASNTWALDSGCIWGGALTALRIDSAEPEWHQVSCPMQQHP